MAVLGTQYGTEETIIGGSGRGCACLVLVQGEMEGYKPDARPLPLSLHPIQFWEDYLHKVANNPYSHVADLPLDSQRLRRQPQALDLDCPILEEEVLAGIYHLRNGRTPGFHGYL